MKSKSLEEAIILQHRQLHLDWEKGTRKLILMWMCLGASICVS